LTQPRFAEAWAESVRVNAEGWGGQVPNIAWRAHVACWAAQHGLSLNGDFVECGVHTGLLSRTICQFLDFGKETRNFWLFDTWSGIPLDGMDEREAESAKKSNAAFYHTDVYPIAIRNFSPYSNVRLVRGALPETLSLAKINSIAYLSIDLNNARAEKAVIEQLWSKVAKGAIILLDDYGFLGSHEQHDMWDAFARDVGKMIVTLPTGQGMLIK
jgi:O-methyltransferase